MGVHQCPETQRSGNLKSYNGLQANESAQPWRRREALALLDWMVKESAAGCLEIRPLFPKALCYVTKERQSEI